MKKTFLMLHLAVLIGSATGLFGKLISMHALPLSFWRTAGAAVIIGLILICRRSVEKVGIGNVLKMAFAGGTIALHWVFFYASIKASNISIGVICYSLLGFFTAFLEPLINGKKFSYKDFFFSLLTVAGILLIFQLDIQFRTGIILGVISTFLASFFSIVSKKLDAQKICSSSNMLMYEMIGGTVVLAVVCAGYLQFHPEIPFLPDNPKDIICLFLLSAICTALMYYMIIQILKQVTAFTVGLTYNLEPVYSIIFAILFFGESKELGLSFCAGITLIMISVGLQTLDVLRNRKKEQTQTQ